MVSLLEDEYAEKMVNGEFVQPEMFCEFLITQSRLQSGLFFSIKYKFRAASPIFAKGKQEKGSQPHHYLYHEPEADAILTATLIHKMDEANKNAGAKLFTDEDKKARIHFDREYANAKIKKVNIAKFTGGKEIFIEHKANVCPVIVEGTKAAVRFAWNVGVGNGTGSCFGSLKE